MTEPTLKTASEIREMAEGGEKLAWIRGRLASAVGPGVTPMDLEHLANKLIKEAGGEASFKRVAGYRWATCINVNEEVVHAIPTDRRLTEGDVVGIDVGLYYRGWHTDTSTTVEVVGKSQIPNPKSQKFLKVGKSALEKAIRLARPGKRVADISRAMQETVEGAGYSVVRALTGHGIGHELHEEPAIPCFVVGEYNRSPVLKPGMVLAVEVMYNLGKLDVIYKDADGWTIITADGKISGLFEETAAVTKDGPVILTQTRKR